MEERHIQILFKLNPLWRDEDIKVPAFKRDLFSHLQKYITYPQALAVIGLRRVGKTVLLHQLIKELKADSLNIGYISFDDVDFQNYTLAYSLIDYFLQHSNPSQRRYLFLDEIQKVPQWPDLLKTIYDTENNIKIIISGSSSLDLTQYKETLAGRLLTFTLPVLSFREFVRFHTLPYSFSFQQYQREYDLHILSKKHKYEELFKRYVAQGAFPELLLIDDEEYCTKYIKEVIEKVIMDISKNIDAGKEREIYNLILLFCKNVGRLYEINSLCSILGVHRNTLSKYISLLEKSLLLKISYNFTSSMAKRLRVSKKAYLAHSCIPIAMLGYPFNLLEIDGVDRGHLVENAFVSNFQEFSFWRDQQYEVDLILQNIPIELKYQSQINPKDMQALLMFMDKYHSKQGFLLTKDSLKVQHIHTKEIISMPIWYFLLCEKNRKG